MNSISKYNKFEEIKRFNPEIGEFWYARSLATVLEYKDWRNFINVINKAKEACLNSKHNILDHFVDVTEMVELGSGAKRQIEDILLSRYACYLIIQNADPSKEIIALGQTYFATQTRKQELEEEKDTSSFPTTNKILNSRIHIFIRQCILHCMPKAMKYFFFFDNSDSR